jgi:MoxR-like ATPase|tara:strand:+ start:1392 stop:2552 length:1161 start_codon:yes stop_codon:yes gene_type:complete
MLTPKKQEFVNAMSKEYGEGAVVSRFEINEFASKNGFNNPSWLKKPQYKCGHGKYQLPTEESEVTQVVSKPIQPVQTPEQTSVNLIANAFEVQNLVPSKFEGFVPWGHYNTIKQISKSGMFYPVFVTGLSGNGKTLMIEQIHAELKKELIRVNITIETDEDDLLGGFRLVNGETKFVPGPVIDAMERGCTLLLDECDLGSNKLMCLQPVLEGKGVYLKKVNKWVTPKQGFNVMATANTKGKGSEDGRFIGTNVLNEAFLERFAITIEQPYADKKVESKIVIGSMNKYGKVDEKFAENLVTWAEVIRKTFYEGGVDEIISTRRLDHVVKAYSIFKDKVKAIDLCVARFDDDTKESFLNLYSKIDAGVDVSAPAVENEVEQDEVVDEE